MIRTLSQDLRYAVRVLLRRPGFTALVVVTLALGIGANTAIFSVVNAFLLRPLPFGEPDRLVMIGSRRGAEKRGVSIPDYHDLRAQNGVFADLAFMEVPGLANVGFDSEVETLPRLYTTSNLFDVLQVKPALGRMLRPDDDKAGAAEVVVLSYDLWTRRFGADRSVLNRQLHVSGKSHTIVGVMPPRFNFPSRIHLWTPAGDIAGWYSGKNRDQRDYSVIGRLKAGVSLERARAEMTTIAGRLALAYPDTNGGVKVDVIPLRDFWVGDVRTSLLLLLGACAFVLLIACVNVANLLLARAAAREREMAIRAALGANRRRLIGQLLTESLLLAMLGTALGLWLALWGVEALVAFVPVELPLWINIRIDGHVLAFTLALAVLTSLVFGSLPAWQASRPDLNESLKEAGRGAGGGSRQSARVRSLLIVSEIALALVLLAGAGLVMKSFLRLQRVDPGFDAERVLTLEVMRTYRRERTPEQVAVLYKQALERIRALPGVEAVGTNSDLPFIGQETWDRAHFTVEHQSIDEYKRNPTANLQVISPDYFRAMGIPLVTGRFFTEEDATRKQGTIISQRMAERFWPGANAIGKRLRPGGPDEGEPDEWDTVIGVVGNVRHNGLNDVAGLDWYRPNFQNIIRFHYVVRARSDPASLAAAVRRKIWNLSPELGVSKVMPLRELTQNSIWQPRLWGMLFGVFSTVALMLAAAGIFGVMNYTVAERTHEIGIRIALGAQRGDVLRLVVGRAMLMTLAGVAVGLTAAFALTRVMSSLLYEVSVTDPIVFVGVSLLLTFVALLASYIPARRAAKVDPMVALKYE